MSAMNTSSGSGAVLRQARTRWSAMPPRERRLVTIATALVLAALLWWVALAPALSLLRSAPERHRTLDAQLLRMRTLQAQAEAIKTQPRQGHDDAVRALEAATREQLGTSGRLVVAGDRATLTLTAAAPGALSQWLTQARANARTLPAEARLNRNAAGAWDGTVVVSLPPR